MTPAARGTIESGGSAPPSRRRAPHPHRRHGLRLLALIGLLAGCAPTRLDTAQLEAAIERFERAAAQAEAAAAQAQASARQAELAAQAAAADTDGAAESTISPDRAIERAEAFVRANGYTDAPPDREAIAVESIEWERSIDQIVAARGGTLKSRAYGYTRGAGGYAVLFQYATGGDRVGRAVMMEADGGRIRMAHQDAMLQGPSVVRTTPAP